MANQPKKYKKFVATAATATLVASAIVPVASAAHTDTAGNQFESYINAATELGLFNDGGEFNPAGTLSRKHVALILGRYLEKAGFEPAADYETNPAFSDLGTADAEYIRLASVVKEAGVFGGDGGKLNGANPIKREQMAKVLDGLSKAVAGTSLVEAAKEIEDVKVDDLDKAQAGYRDQIQALADFEITTVSTFNPKGDVTRGQFAKFIMTTIGAIEDIKEGIKPTPEQLEAAKKAVEEAVAALPAVASITKENAADAKAKADAVDAAVAAAEKLLAKADLTDAEKAEAQKGLDAAKAAAKAVADKVAEVTKPVVGLAVESVSAINNTQVAIKFNQKVDKTTAENLSNYYVGLTKDVANSSIAKTNNTGATPNYVAVLQKDEQTVVITAVDASTHSIWKDEYTTSHTPLVDSTGADVLKDRTVYVQIKDIKTAQGTLASALETSFVATDSVGPKFAENIFSVEKVDVDEFTVKFDEPVIFDFDGDGAYDAGETQFYLNGVNVTSLVTYTKSGTTKFATGDSPEDLKSITIKGLNAKGIELNENTNTFEAVGLEDLAGNATTPSRITANIKVEAENVVAPKVVGVEQVYDSAFRVIFDKPVADAGTVTIKNIDGQNNDYVVDIKNAGTLASKESKIDPNFKAPAGTTQTAYLVDFDPGLLNSPYGNANTIIRTVVVEDYKVGTKTGAKFSQAYSFVKDIQAPTIANATVNTDDYQDILLTFTDTPFNGHATLPGAAPTTDYVFLKLVENGVTTTVAVPYYANTTQYTVTTGGVTTNVKNTFELDLNPAVTTGETITNATGTTVTYAPQSELFTNGKLKSGITVTLPYGAVIDTTSDDTPQYTAGHVFIGGSVAVSGGSNAVVPQTSQANVSYNDALRAIDVVFVGENIDATTVTNKANYTFDGVSVANISGATIEYSTSNNTKLARIFLPENSVVRDGNYGLAIKNVATVSGAQMLPTNVTVYDVKDNTAPVLASAKVTSDKTLEVTFDETLANTAGTITTTNFEQNFKVIVGGATYNVASVAQKAGSTLTLVLTTVDTFDITKATQVQIAPNASKDVYVKDVAGNKAASKTVNATKDIQ